MSEEIIEVGEFVYPCPLDKLPKLVEQFNAMLDDEDALQHILSGAACWCNTSWCSTWEMSRRCHDCILCTNYGDQWADRVKAFVQFAEEHGHDMSETRRKLRMPQETSLAILTTDIFKDYPAATCAAVDDSGLCWVY